MPYSRILVFASFLCVVSASPGTELHDAFDTPELNAAWTMSTVLSQGEGARPEYVAEDGCLLWRYTSGTRNAQQQVLLRGDAVPAVGEAVQVRLFLEDFAKDGQDFAGLALSASGHALSNRVGLLIFHLEPNRRLRLWHFTDSSDEPGVAHEIRPDFSGAETLLLRVVRTGDTKVRAYWSTGNDDSFHALPPVRFPSIKAAGLYNGNSRRSGGNRIRFDNFRVLACDIPDTEKDFFETTPSWTHPEAFLAAEGNGAATGWPRVVPEARPGAYWWWPGSAVTREDITWNLETYRRAGWGNMGVIGIYGVKGEEDRAIDFFSPKWFEMFNHAVAEAERLGMNIDLTASSGWRMGGPHVTQEYAERSFAVANGQIVAKNRKDKVKRAGPGGEGLTVNPYSPAAMAFHQEWVAQRFAEGEGRAPRAFYYDSFENPGNWCPELLDAFRRLRGYPLEEHAEALVGLGDADDVRRVVCDYRETLSDLLIDCVEKFGQWAKTRGSAMRMQAHGAPANLLDMYAAAEIPETEVFGASKFDIPGFRREEQWIRADQQSDLVNRFASSAAHVAGRKVVISESFTWLRNHYHTALSHIKAESDRLLLNGINCIYYHGLCFAPEKTAWPGWLFYASTQGNARNSIFRDVPALNAYLTRCQSVLQQGQPHNDVLLYWPIHDLWMAGGKAERRFAVHHPEWIDATPCGDAGRWMIDNGYTFDFVSDRGLASTTYDGDHLRTAGGAEYRTILVPCTTVMKVSTLQHLLKLAGAGATILIWNELPQDVPGWKKHEARKVQLDQFLGKLIFQADGAARVGKGRVAVSTELRRLLDVAVVAREPMVDHGLRFIRRKSGAVVSYFVANHSAQPVDAWVPLASSAKSVLLMDPMTARTGVALHRNEGGRTDVHLQMVPGESRVLRVFPDRTIDGSSWPVLTPGVDSLNVEGTWQVEFVEGGPVLPETGTTNALGCWTAFGEGAACFAGAARYTVMVNIPELEVDGWWLDLGDVRESARVWLNGKPEGILVAHPFRVDLGERLKPGSNELAIEVTNLSANRIRDLDRRGVEWKKFHDINFVSHEYKRFDASEWDLKPSGLLGPVTLVPYRVTGQGSAGRP